jgi:hypothetical protein
MKQLNLNWNNGENGENTEIKPVALIFYPQFKYLLPIKTIMSTPLLTAYAQLGQAIES